MKSNWDKYLDPPDEPEAQYCDGCGEEMPILDDFGGQKYQECVNPFCPDKHTGVAKEIADALADAMETIRDMKGRMARLERRLSISDYLLETKK